MTDAEKLILEKLDGLGHEIREVRNIAEEALSTAKEALSESRESRKIAEEALSTAKEALNESRESRKISEEALSTAKEALAEARKARITSERMMMILENDIVTQIRVIGEGHDFLKFRLEQAMTMERKREQMELDILGLKMDMKKVKNLIHMA